jgi:protein-disulfide isomerase
MKDIRTDMMRRQRFLGWFLMAAAAGGLWLAGLGSAAIAQGQGPSSSEMALGKADAPLTIIEYASMTCPHCAAFHVETLPKLKAAYIDTGKVRLVFREFPLDEPGLRAAMLARCSGPERYFGFLDVLFKQQTTWAKAADPLQSLMQIGRLGGVGDDAFKACMGNRQMESQILANRLEGQNKHGVRSTPSFVVGGATHAGARTFEEFKALIDPLLPAGKTELIQPRYAAGVN